MNRQLTMVLIVFFATGFCYRSEGVNLRQSDFQLEGHKIKFSTSIPSGFALQSRVQAEDTQVTEGNVTEAETKRKSPVRAFLYSFAVPGLGQYYNGDKLKAAVFLGLEVTAWAYNIKYDNQGQDLQTAFETFNKTHWSRDRYEQDYLWEVYGVTSDTGLTGSEHITHHLPPNGDQQFYEMTGKYDQFAWGWDDAFLGPDSLTLAELIAAGQLDAINSADSSTVPYTANRFHYEQMRDDSNQKYKVARKMATLALVNHLLAGFEAFFRARSNNKAAGDSDDAAAQWSVRADLKSYRSKRDTPYLQVAYKF